MPGAARVVKSGALERSAALRRSVAKELEEKGFKWHKGGVSAGVSAGTEFSVTISQGARLTVTYARRAAIAPLRR